MMSLGRSASGSIGRRLAVAFAAMFALVIAISGAVGVWGVPGTGFTGWAGSFRTSAERTIGLIADVNKRRLEHWVEERRRDLAASASDPRLRRLVSVMDDPGAMAELHAVLRDMQLLSPILRAARLAEPTGGAILASSLPGETGRDAFDPILTRRLQSADSDSRLASRTLPAGEDGEAKLRLARPVVDVNGQVAAELILDFALADVAAEVVQTAPGLGETGDTVLADSGGSMIFARSPEGGPVPHRIDSVAVQRARAGESGMVVGIDYRGQETVAAYRHLQISPDSAWSLVVKMDRAELQRAEHAALLASGTIGILAVGLAVAASLVLGRWLTAPLRQLEAVAGRLSAGERGVRADIRREDEIGRLGKAFNLMSEQVAQSWADYEALNADLERRVKARSRDLERRLADLQRAEASLRASEQRFRSVTQAAQDAIVGIDDTGHILFWNAGAEAVFGHDAAAAMQMNFEQLFPQRFRAAQRAALRAPEAGQVVDGWAQRRDGREFPVEISAGTWSAGGHGYTVYVMRDVSQRREVEEQLGKLSRAVEQSPVLVVITDTDGRIEYANPSFVKVSGYDMEEILGQTPSILKSGQTPTDEYARLWKTVRTGHDWRGEFCNQRKNGEYFWVSSVISPIKNREGEITNYVGIAENITQAKRTEQQLRQAQRLEAIGQLTGGIAHDFNNLLAVIDGNLEFLSEELDPDDPRHRMIDRAVKAVESGSELIERLLAFSRTQHLKPRRAILADVIAGTIKMLGRTLGEGIHLHTDCPEGGWPVRVDRTQFENAVLNLAINARDAMTAGGDITIAVRNLTITPDEVDAFDGNGPGDYVRVDVRDTGEGMPDEVAQRAFDPFFTTKPAGQGSGLGLSMVYGFAKQSKGFSLIRTAPGAGTTVSLFLPRLAEDPEAAAPAHGPAPVPAGGGEAVLVVEDDEGVRRIACARLERLGYRVLAAADAEAARKLLAAEPSIDLLFTDVVLPGRVSGAELARQVLRERPGTRVLLTSGYPADHLAGDAQLRDLPLLKKPYNRHDLARAVGAVLDAG